MTRDERGDRFERAVWEGDIETLYEIAPCVCCCHEHTFEGCPARAWYGCRGQGQVTHEEIESWVRHYARFHGMTREEFFAEDPPIEVAIAHREIDSG